MYYIHRSAFLANFICQKKKEKEKEKLYQSKTEHAHDRHIIANLQEILPLICSVVVIIHHTIWFKIKIKN